MILAQRKTRWRRPDAVIVVVGNTLDDEGEYIPGDIALGADVPAELREQKRAQVRGGDRH